MYWVHKARTSTLIGSNAWQRNNCYPIETLLKGIVQGFSGSVPSELVAFAGSENLFNLRYIRNYTIISSTTYSKLFPPSSFKDYIQIESEPTSFHYSSQQAAWELIFFFQLSSRGAEPLIIQAEQPMIKARELSQVS